MIHEPTSVYINWASYDEISDNVELTEKLALQQLDELLRLRALGIRFDYYLMDAYWFAPDGGYREWRKPHWPNGPGEWLKRCLDNGVKPGLWVTANTLSQMTCIPEWRDSFQSSSGFTSGQMCLFYGGFLAHFMETLSIWYERGVRMFKFDFADFGAAPQHLLETLLPSEIRAANISAFQGALKAFRHAHPEVVLLAYNGYEEVNIQSGTSSPLRKAVDQRWLEVFDSLYCGDPRLADIPAMNFWRSKDIYSDHMVRYYEFNGVPLQRIDNTSFMIGTTGTCYFRGTAAWKGMLLLSLARGGWMNTYYGNLDLLDEARALWFAKVQRLFFELQARAVFRTFGPMPGSGEPYGYTALENGRGLVTVVNPSQRVQTVSLPGGLHGRILFSDAGFVPSLNGSQLFLGPEQLVLIGIGSYADAAFDLGVQEDVVIPRKITPLEIPFKAENEKAISTSFLPQGKGSLRIIVRQLDQAGVPKRSSGGCPPHGITLGKILKIEACQDGTAVPVAIAHDKAIWSGLSWAAGEISSELLNPDEQLSIHCSTTETSPVTLTGELYWTEF